MKEIDALPDAQDVFGAFHEEYNLLKLYYALNKRFASRLCVQFIDRNKFFQWIRSGQLTLKHMMEDYRLLRILKGKNSPTYSFFILENGIIIEQLSIQAEVFIYFDPSLHEEAMELAQTMKRACRQTFSRKGRIQIIIEDSGLKLNELKVDRPKIRLDGHYNEDLLPVHTKILSFIKRKKSSGLILLHGQPGTGKSTYIRHLICQTKKQVLFLSPQLASSLDNPSLMVLLIENPGCIIVIEDAEELLLSRQSGRNNAVSTILNLTDGILGNSLGIQFIATFNTPIHNIDQALLRKGRLKMMYEFGPLSLEKTCSLFKALHPDLPTPTKPMTLAEIYHAHTANNNNTRQANRPIGFQVHRNALGDTSAH